MKELTAVRFDAKELERLKEIAKRDDLSVSWLVRRAVKEFLEREGKRK